jgi:hypothetical protein
MKCIIPDTSAVIIGAVSKLLEAAGTYKDIRVFKDLAGLDRVIIAERI